MKRLITLFMAIVLVLTITVSVSAAQFVPSITNKGAPQFVVIDQLNGKDVIGYITGPDGEQLSTEFLECLDITSLIDALNNNADVPEAVRKALLDAYEELKKPDTKISKLCPAIDAIVKEQWGADKSADDLVVKELFDVTDYCDDIDKHFKDGAILDLTFDLGIPAGSFITAMVFVDGKWQPVVDCINNGDGTVTVKFDKICPIAFLVPGNGADGTIISPLTSDSSSVVVWSCVLVSSLVAIAVLFVIRRKRANG
ncbi:MAG: hypothetical protein IKB73_02500 [Ruminococcus sp.]|nr:hypothetical protein [Ruminococcus sp.]